MSTHPLFEIYGPSELRPEAWAEMDFDVSLEVVEKERPGKRPPKESLEAKRLAEGLHDLHQCEADDVDFCKECMERLLL